MTEYAATKTKRKREEKTSIILLVVKTKSPSLIKPT
jgi:hypothetical protein